jgi:hypothetical protein
MWGFGAWGFLLVRGCGFVGFAGMELGFWDVGWGAFFLHTWRTKIKSLIDS